MDTTKISFEMIMYAGDAKYYAMESYDLIADGKYEEAEEKLKEAKIKYNLAHKAHKCILDKIMCDGETVTMDLMLTHALDHITSAELVILLAEKTLSICKNQLIKKGGTL